MVLDRDAKHTSVVGAKFIMGLVLRHPDAVGVAVHYKTKQHIGHGLLLKADVIDSTYFE